MIVGQVSVENKQTGDCGDREDTDLSFHSFFGTEERRTRTDQGDRRKRRKKRERKLTGTRARARACLDVVFL